MIFDLLATTVLSLAPTFAVFNVLTNKKMEEHLKASFLLAIVALIFGIPAVFESVLGLPSLALATVPTTTTVALPGGAQFIQIFTNFIVAIVTYWLAMIIATVVLKFGEIRFS